jgi:PAS domain S-box-containing protein
MVLLTVLIGVVCWTVLDYFQTKNIRSLFMAQTYERLNSQSEENWLRFDRYMKAYTQSALIYVQTRNFNDYVNRQKWSVEDKSSIKYYTHPPSWFPDRKIQIVFDNPRFALLFDGNKEVREVYLRHGDAPPLPLLNSPSLLLSKSKGQRYITKINDVPYLLTSESLLDPRGNPLAILMFASPINDEFLMGSFGISTREHTEVLLTSEEKPRIIASTNLADLSAGVPLKKVKDKYFIGGEALIDSDNSDLSIRLISLISKAEVENLTKSVIWHERRINAAASLIFILSFTAIMFWITYRIRYLTGRISDFSQKMLGAPQEKLKKGDELYALHERFRYLTKEVVDARDELSVAIRREAEEKTKLIVNNAFDAIITMDADGVVTTWNPMAEKLFGWLGHEIIGQKVVDTIIPLFHRKAHEEGLRRFLSTGEGRILNRTIETTALHRKGYEFTVELEVAYASSGNEKTFIAMIRDISERKEAEEHIKASLREKEVLLKEIHHRVKNNMQIISSLLRLQAGKNTDERENEMLRESRNRIRSMSLIHEKLYRTSDLSHINFKDYIYDLIKGLYRSYGTDTKKSTFNIEAEDILLDIDTAIPCGLIVNELVSNALKYAFPGDRRGSINVKLRRILERECNNDKGKIQNQESKIFELTVSDNGIGMPVDFNLQNTESLGLKLVATLSENQLNGRINYISSEGTHFQIRFQEKYHDSLHDMQKGG